MSGRITGRTIRPLKAYERIDYAPVQEAEAEAEREAEIALRKVLAVVQRYLPPDGQTAMASMSEIIGIIDPWPVPPAESAAQEPDKWLRDVEWLIHEYGRERENLGELGDESQPAFPLAEAECERILTLLHTHLRARIASENTDEQMRAYATADRAPLQAEVEGLREALKLMCATLEDRWRAGLMEQSHGRE